MLKSLIMGSPSLFLNDFTVLDFAFVSEASGIEGDSFHVSVELFGELDQKDFLFDFSPAKKALKALVDGVFDHKLLIPMGAGIVTTRADGLDLQAAEAGIWSYNAPREAYELFPDSEISAEVLEYHLNRLAKSRLPENVNEARFHLRSPSRFESEANFRYTHGLRFHDGNCQRLFHGHRNPIEVTIDGRRSPNWEARLADEWSGVHFAALSTIKNLSDLDLQLGVRQKTHPGEVLVEYVSGHGAFSARIPASRVVVTKGEPSIETISILGAQRLREWNVKGELRVLAYEGLNKGASYTLPR